MDEALSGFHLANAIAVIAMTAGKRHPVLLGADLVDADAFAHPGLIPSGIPMLQTDQNTIYKDAVFDTNEKSLPRYISAGKGLK